MALYCMLSKSHYFDVAWLPVLGIATYIHVYITTSYHLLCSVIPEVLSRSDNSKYNAFKQLS